MNMPRLYTKKPVTVAATQWFKNGDHPDDGPAYQEGKIVRYFRRPEPEYRGILTHEQCGLQWRDHGWIDAHGGGGYTVCPGDWIVTHAPGEHSVCKMNLFAATYEPAVMHDPYDPACRRRDPGGPAREDTRCYVCRPDIIVEV